MNNKNLRTEQPHLWERVKALFLTFFFIGLPLLWAPSERTPTANISVMQNLLHLKYHAFIFMAIAILLYIGSKRAKKNYEFLRMSLSIAFGYTLMWWLSLIHGAFYSPSSAGIIALWTFFMYIILNTLRDPGFIISDLIREVRKHHDVRR